MSKLKGFIGETLVYGFGNVFSRIFAMFLIPLYAKYLGKIDYSNLVMLQAVFTVLTFFTGLNAGVFYYYYEYDNLRYRKIVLTSWFYYQLVISLCILIILFFSSQFLYKLFIVDATNIADLKLALILIAVQLFPYIFNNTNLNFFRIERKAKSAVVIVLLEACFTLLSVSLVLIVFNLGLVEVIIAQIFSRLLVSIIYINKAKTYVFIKNFSKALLKKIFKYAWPFILSSIFSVIIVNADKFVGAQVLTSKEDVALLALAMQLTLPISVLSDMIRMALGPYIMSIRKEKDAESTYQQVFDLTIFAASIVVLGIIALAPFLTLILTNKSFINVIYVIPLIAFSSVLKLASNQFSISFNLCKKNIFILYGILIAGILGLAINFVFMRKYGFIISGVSQIISYLAMAIFLYFYGRKIANLKIKLKNSAVIVLLLGLFIFTIYFINSYIILGNYYYLLILSFLFGIAILTTYFMQHKLNLRQIVMGLLKRT
ncbi:MAG: oligosaccharide flippase family protein [Bacteroidales bacterium]|nr:oligosaccharide flippase family protein [Bacteroidales bacterium]